MSYHVQQNTQQKSFGIFIVIAFHMLLIWGLASGLGSSIGKIFIPENITLKPQPQKVVPPEKVDPQEVVIQSKNVFTTDPTDNPLIFEDSKITDTTGDIVGGGIIEPTISLTKPRLIHATKPDYPLAASRLGEEGTTGLSLYVTAEGRVADAKIFSSSGSSNLDKAAIKHALRNWAFTPCMEGGKAVACWHTTKLVWRLEDAKR